MTQTFKKMKAHAPSRFSWNLGGLIGSALGCSAWMVASAVASKWPPFGVVTSIVCAAAIWITVPQLWRQRPRLTALAGVFIFLTVAFLSTLVLLAVAHMNSFELVVSWPPLRFADAASCYWILILFPALALLFLALECFPPNTSEQAVACDGDSAPA